MSTPSPSARAPEGRGAPPQAATSLAARPSGLFYIIVAVIIALSQGLSQGFVSANLPQMAGDLGISVTDASWLVAAYMIPRASLPLLLTKLRTQYGLLAFARVAGAFAALVSFAACFTTDFHSALTLQFIAGCAAAPMSTLAFLYMLEPLPQRLKLIFGLPLALAVIMTAPTLARVLSPALIGDGGFLEVHLLILGLALLAFALLLVLPLNPAPTEKVIALADLSTFALIAFSFGSLTVVMIMGPIHWWFETPWIGWLLAAAVIALAVAVGSELSRKSPLVDFRWLMSPMMLQMSAAMLIFRILLSEQSTGALRMFQVLGFGPDAMVALFAIVSIASLVAPLACLAFLRPGREPWLHMIALLLIAFGCWLDSRSTVQTTPRDMAFSQMLIAFSGMLFMAPAMVMGLLTALSKGPSYLMSFIVVFLSTQSLGGVIGAGVFTSLTNVRQAYHFQTLTEKLVSTGRQTQDQIAQGLALVADQIIDPAAARAKAVSLLIEDATRQSWVLAYNDAYWLCAMLALGALAVLGLHMLLLALRDRLNSSPDTPSDGAKA